MIKWKIGKIIGGAFLLFAAYLLLGGLVPPLFHKEIPDVRCNMGQAEENSVAASERVRCIDDNEEALIWRLKLIESAQEEIILSTFDLREDNSGRDMMACLLQAADRGVQVKIFVDGINGMLQLWDSDCFNVLAAHPNVEAKLYNPVNLLLPWRLNYRMHDKYLIADNTAYLLGGRNTNDLFLGNYRESYNIDRDILVYEEENATSGSLAQFRAYFESIWALESNKMLKGTKNTGKTAEAKEWQTAHYEELKIRYPAAFKETDWQEETVAATRVELLVNPIGPKNKEPGLWATLVKVMEEGHNILIQTPYIICNDAMYCGLTGLCEDGKQLQIITNAVENGANPWGCTDYLNQKKQILQTGVTVSEFLGGQSLHTKTVLVDDNISVVGSFNLDIRSAYLDTEMMLYIDCPELNAGLRKTAETQLDYCRHVAPDGLESFGAEYREVALPTGKKLFYGIVRIVVLPFRYLL